MADIGLVNCNLSVTIFVAEILVFGVAAAKLTSLKALGVLTEKVEEQFMYEL